MHCFFIFFFFSKSNTLLRISTLDTFYCYGHVWHPGQCWWKDFRRQSLPVVVGDHSNCISNLQWKQIRKISYIGFFPLLLKSEKSQATSFVAFRGIYMRDGTIWQSVKCLESARVILNNLLNYVSNNQHLKSHVLNHSIANSWVYDLLLRTTWLLYSIGAPANWSSPIDLRD